LAANDGRYAGPLIRISSREMATGAQWKG